MIFYLGLASIFFLSTVSAGLMPDYKYEGGAFVLKSYKGDLAITANRGGNVTTEAVMGVGEATQRWTFLDHVKSDDDAVFQLRQPQVQNNVFSGMNFRGDPRQIEIVYIGNEGPDGVPVHQIKLRKGCLQHEGIEGAALFIDHCELGKEDGNSHLWRLERVIEGRAF